MSKITFYHQPESRGRVARWMLEEVGAPYETKLVNWGKEMKSPEYLDINAMGKVPALVHGDQVITEVAAICAYLADAFPSQNLAPHPEKRGDYYRWLFFTAGPFEQLISFDSVQYEIPPQKEGFLGCGNKEVLYNALSEKLKQSTYVCGEQFTAADVYLGAYIGWWIQYGLIPKRPEYELYFHTISNRPAFKRANELDDELTQQIKVSYKDL